jgi:hypothetical protein
MSPEHGAQCATYSCRAVHRTRQARTTHTQAARAGERLQARDAPLGPRSGVRSQSEIGSSSVEGGEACGHSRNESLRLTLENAGGASTRLQSRGTPSTPFDLRRVPPPFVQRTAAEASPPAKWHTPVPRVARIAAGDRAGTSVLYAPWARLTLLGVGSSKNAATRPKMGSAGTGTTVDHKHLRMIALWDID